MSKPFAFSHCITPALAIADAWASIDGKVDEFRAGQKADSIVNEPGGHFSGYLYEAEEMIRRIEARGFTVIPSAAKPRSDPMTVGE